MDTNKSLAGLSVLVAGALVAGGALAAGGGVWYLQRRATVAAEQRVAAAEADTRKLERRTSQLESELTSVSAALRRASLQKPAEDADTTSGDGASDAEDGKNIGYVAGVRDEGATDSLVVDYAELLTGQKAVDAHKADGLGDIDGEQYYIRNVNPRKRTIPVAEDAKVVVWSWFAETEDINAKEIPLAEFMRSMPDGPDAEEARYRLPYWFTVSGGEIVRIEEQFVP